MNESLLFNSIYGEEIYVVPPNLWVTLDIPWNDVTVDQRELLNKILLAIGSSIEAVRIIHQKSFDVSAWKEKPQHVLAFLVPPKGLTPYEVIQTSETTVIFSASLQQLTSDDTAKRKLWAALKSLLAAQ
jgi:DNA polymerase III psi subunit